LILNFETKVPDYKIPPKPEPVNKTTIAIILGALLILGVGYLFWSGKLKFPKKVPVIPAPSQQSSAQKEQQRQQALNEIISQQGYPQNIPQDLVLNPLALPKTQVVTDKKTGKITTTVQYTEEGGMGGVEAGYVQSLKDKGWTVTVADTPKTPQINISKGAVQGSFSFGFMNPLQTQVVLSYSDK